MSSPANILRARALLAPEVARDDEAEADVLAARRTVQTAEERLRSSDRLLFSWIVTHGADVMAPDEALGLREWTVSARHKTTGDQTFRSARELGDAIIALHRAIHDPRTWT